MGRIHHNILYILLLRRDDSGEGKLYDPSSDLSYEDLAADNSACPQVISIQIKCSKTDQERRDVQVVIGRTENDLCLVVALMNYLTKRGNKPGPWRDESPLTKSRFVSEVRRALSLANLPATSFARHSSCIGAATTAAIAELEDSTIQTPGRWWNSSYLLYVRLEPQRLASLRFRITDKVLFRKHIHRSIAYLIYIVIGLLSLHMYFIHFFIN